MAFAVFGCVTPSNRVSHHIYGKYCHYLCITDEETEDWRSIICPKSCSCHAEPELRPESSDYRRAQASGVICMRREKASRQRKYGAGCRKHGFGASGKSTSSVLACHSDHTPGLKTREREEVGERRMGVNSERAFSSGVSGQRWVHKTACFEIQITVKHKGKPENLPTLAGNTASRALWSTTFIQQSIYSAPTLCQHWESVRTKPSAWIRALLPRWDPHQSLCLVHPGQRCPLGCSGYPHILNFTHLTREKLFLTSFMLQVFWKPKTREKYP